MGDLTEREMLTLRLRAQGMTALEAAYKMGISDQTVKNNMTSIYQKLGVNNLASALTRMGWLRVPGTEASRCDYIGSCGRAAGHRGHHGGFRPV